MIGVVLADDESMMRAGVRAIVTADPQITVLGEAADGHQALAQVVRHRPQVALFDIRMPRMDGLAAAARVREQVPETALVMLTLFGEDAYIAAALEMGVSGFVLKTGDPGDLMAAVRAAADGGAFLSPPVARRVLDHLDGTRSHAARERVGALSPREREVLALIGQGLTNTLIAQRLGLAPSTVKTHVDAVRARLGVRTRVQAALVAYDAGLLHTDP
ncbi:LuxR family two component transcriptional regulator [Nocardiopsis sp. Huas11]|uniref:response regulator n=1 Tax=Nocardiopsis sp. Huas11 TaxID=2183912 RepID=UPI000EAC22CA|nr:response regulator transcription factor [Nocardiopsis sp. Huas11]RKS08673.1 LuxR family two component transcriptional regulator [Nocardiopsis sp. Huas11]